MTQKIVIRVSMTADKCRCKALKIAVCAPGVESAALTGDDKNQVEVVGVGIDSVELTRRLRKSFGCADLVSVGEVPAKKKEEEEKKKPEVVLAPPDYCYPYYNYYEVAEPTTCTIL